jgi:hypothetical protein
MSPKTNFSFEVQYVEGTAAGKDERDGVMASLGPLLQKLFAANDPSATVTVSESHKGDGNRIIELVTTLQDAQIAGVLQAFSSQHGVTVSALE